jgi:hypothetical protein
MERAIGISESFGTSEKATISDDELAPTNSGRVFASSCVGDVSIYHMLIRSTAPGLRVIPVPKQILLACACLAFMIVIFSYRRIVTSRSKTVALACLRLLGGSKSR